MVDAIDACMFSIVCISFTNVEIKTKAQLITPMEFTGIVRFEAGNTANVSLAGSA